MDSQKRLLPHRKGVQMMWIGFVHHAVVPTSPSFSLLSRSVSFQLHSSTHVSSCLLEYYVLILPSHLLILLTLSKRPLPDEQPCQSVANLIGRFELQQKRQPGSSGPPLRATSATSNNTGDTVKEEQRITREWPPVKTNGSAGGTTRTGSSPDPPTSAATLRGPSITTPLVPTASDDGESSRPLASSQCCLGNSVQTSSFSNLELTNW